MSITIDDLWAKTNPFESVESHLIRTGLVCKVALKKSSLISVWDILRNNCEGIDDENLLNFICYIVAMHDIGKVSPHFQGMNEEQKVKLGELYKSSHCANFRHELQSRKYLYDILLNKGLDDDLAESFSYCVGMHHYKFTSKYNEENISSKIQSAWEEFVDKIEKSVFSRFTFSLNKSFIIKNYDNFFHFLLGILILSDWLASNDSFSLYNIDEVDLDLIFYKLLIQHGFGEKQINKDLYNYQTLLNNTHLSLRPFQRWSTEYFNAGNSFDLMIIEAGTGEGKTSVGLYSALQVMSNTDGFYLALPMKVMVESKYKELKDIFNENGAHLTLLHGSRQLIDDLDDSETYIDFKNDNEAVNVSNYLFSDSRRGLFNKYVVGTIDQLLFSVLPTKFSLLRLIGLSGKVLILDEIHSYDSYTNQLICRLLSWCKALNIKVILMSATIQKSLKEEFIKAYLGSSVSLTNNGYPLITVINKNELKEIDIESSEKKKKINLELLDILMDMDKQCDKILESYNENNNIVVFKNTVKESQYIYDKLVELGVDKDDLLLCHSNMTIEDRSVKENKVIKLFGKNTKNRPSKFIVICTQVFEASIDIDFDVSFSDLAPIDILIQRWGRECRFDIFSKSTQRGKYYVFIDTTLDFGVSQFIYYKLFLSSTQTFLINHTDLLLPDELRQSIESVYTFTDFTKEYFDWVNSEKIKKNKGLISTIEIPDKDSFTPVEHEYTFFDEDNCYDLSTRMFNSQKNIIVIDKNELNSYNINNINNINFNTFKKLMKKSLLINENKFSLKTKKGSEYINIIDGNILNSKYLKNIYIIPMLNNVYECEDITYIYSLEKGLEIKKEK